MKRARSSSTFTKTWARRLREKAGERDDFSLNPAQLVAPADYGKYIPAHLQGENREYQKFIILSYARSGSGFLTYSLRSNPEVMCYFELFNPGPPIPFNTEGFNNGCKELFSLRKYRPIDFLENIVFHGYPGHIGAVGFKIFPDHLEFDGLSKHPRSMKDLKIIHLRRKNLLRAHLSLETARKTGHYTLKSASDRRNVSIPLDEDGCREFFLTMEEKEREAREYYKDSDRIDVTYEDLVENYSHETQRVQTFLGLNPQALACPILKQNTQTLAQSITNFKSLKEKFTGTSWRRFFEE